MTDCPPACLPAGAHHTAVAYAAGSRADAGMGGGDGMRGMGDSRAQRKRSVLYGSEPERSVAIDRGWQQHGLRATRPPMHAAAGMGEARHAVP